MSQKRPMRYNDNTPEARAYRAKQADIDCDIEGMSRDPDLAALVDDLLNQGIRGDEAIAVFLNAFHDKFSS